MHPRTIKLAADGALELIIYGKIGLDFFGDGVSAGRIVDILSAHRDAPSITVRLNSPGGSAFDGVAIYNVLKQHPARVTVYVDGVAASSASIIAMAGDTVTVAAGSLMMIHNATTDTSGGATDLRKAADLVEKLNGQMADIYAARGNASAARYAELMAEETWLNAGEAIALGLADEEDANALAIAAHFDPAAYGYRNAPASIVASAPKNQPAPVASPKTEAPTAPGDTHMKIFAQAAGLKADATEAEIVAAVSDLRSSIANASADRAIVAAIEKHTGKSGEEAVGLVVAWKAADERATAAEAKLAESIKAQADAEAKDLIDGLVADGRLEPAKRASADGMYAEFGIKALNAFAAALPPKGIVVDVKEPAPVDPKATADGEALTQDERDVMRATGKSESEIRALRDASEKINSGARYEIRAAK